MIGRRALEARTIGEPGLRLWPILVLIAFCLLLLLFGLLLLALILVLFAAFVSHGLVLSKYEGFVSSPLTVGIMRRVRQNKKSGSPNADRRVQIDR